MPLLPEAELVHTVRAGGMSDAAWLLELATPEQRVACFDLDCWKGAEIEIPRVQEWLDALIEGGPSDPGEGAGRDRPRARDSRGSCRSGSCRGQQRAGTADRLFHRGRRGLLGRSERGEPAPSARDRAESLRRGARALLAPGVRNALRESVGDGGGSPALAHRAARRPRLPGPRPGHARVPPARAGEGRGVERARGHERARDLDPPAAPAARVAARRGARRAARVARGRHPGLRARRGELARGGRRPLALGARVGAARAREGRARDRRRAARARARAPAAARGDPRPHRAARPLPRRRDARSEPARAPAPPNEPDDSDEEAT